MTNLLILSISLATNISNASWHEPMSDEWKTKTNLEAQESTNEFVKFQWKSWNSNYAETVYNPYHSCRRTNITRTIKIGQQIGTNITSAGEIVTQEEPNPHSHQHLSTEYFENERRKSNIKLDQIMNEVLIVGDSNILKDFPKNK